MGDVAPSFEPAPPTAHPFEDARRYAAVLLLGFASGLPLALTGQALQAWLALDGVDMATIAFFSMVGLPYAFKFLWAPLMDRFEPPFFGRRRGWLVLTQLGLAAALVALSVTPTGATQTFALIAVLIAFLSASQDVVIDAWRTDVLAPAQRGLGGSLTVLGYRLGMILSGGIALIWADPAQGGGTTWPDVYRIMAVLMVGAAVLSAAFVPRVRSIAPTSEARNDLLGFAAVLVAAIVGYQVTQRLVAPAFASMAATELAKKWADVGALAAGLAFTLPLAWWAARKARFDTLTTSLAAYFAQPGAATILVFIVLYKLGDAFAGALTTPFLLKVLLFSQAEVGVVNKVIGIWLTIGGALVGGAILAKIGLYRSLLVFGGLQLLSNLGFYGIAVAGKGAWGSFTLPAFDWGIVSLAHDASVDNLLLAVVAGENVSGGMGTAAFVAFLMALCNQRFTATQYALLSAFASVGRVWVGPLSGVLTESVGWPTFFLLSMGMALPGLALLMRLRGVVEGLEKR